MGQLLLDVVDQAWTDFAAVASALFSRLWPRRATIQAATISEEWLTEYQTEAPKHAEDL